MTEPVLQVADLVTTVRTADRDVAAVDGVSFRIDKGRAFGLVGESGCGKSLTALSIARLLDEPRTRIASGRIEFAGHDLVTASEKNLRGIRGRTLAMVFQEPGAALDPVMTIGDQVGEPLRVHGGASRAEARTRAIELLREVGIPDPEIRAAAYPHQLSGGLKQRVLIAMALACRPELLIADEPTTALDVTVQAQIGVLLDDLRRRYAMSLLLISHDLGVVAETCDEVAVMYAGRIVEQAPTRTLLDRPRHPYTHGLLGALASGGEGGRLREIPGAVPRLGQTTAGCAFAPRCPRVTGACRENPPALDERGQPGHRVRCIHPMQA